MTPLGMARIALRNQPFLVPVHACINQGPYQPPATIKPLSCKSALACGELSRQARRSPRLQKRITGDSQNAQARRNKAGVETNLTGTCTRHAREAKLRKTREREAGGGGGGDRGDRADRRRGSRDSGGARTTNPVHRTQGKIRQGMAGGHTLHRVFPREEGKAFVDETGASASACRGRSGPIRVQGVVIHDVNRSVAQGTERAPAEPLVDARLVELRVNRG